jgi:hypothetical protein
LISQTLWFSSFCWIWCFDFIFQAFGWVPYIVRSLTILRYSFCLGWTRNIDSPTNISQLMVKFNPKVSNSRHYLSKQMASLDYTMHVAINTLRIFEYTSQPWNIFLKFPKHQPCMRNKHPKGSTLWTLSPHYLWHSQNQVARYVH